VARKNSEKRWWTAVRQVPEYLEYTALADNPNEFKRPSMFSFKKTAT